MKTWSYSISKRYSSDIQTPQNIGYIGNSITSYSLNSSLSSVFEKGELIFQRVGFLQLVRFRLESSVLNIGNKLIEIWFDPPEYDLASFKKKIFDSLEEKGFLFLYDLTEEIFETEFNRFQYIKAFNQASDLQQQKKYRTIWELAKYLDAEFKKGNPSVDFALLLHVLGEVVTCYSSPYQEDARNLAIEYLFSAESLQKNVLNADQAAISFFRRWLTLPENFFLFIEILQFLNQAPELKQKLVNIIFEKLPVKEQQGFGYVYFEDAQKFRELWQTLQKLDCAIPVGFLLNRLDILQSEEYRAEILSCLRSNSCLPNNKEQIRAFLDDLRQLFMKQSAISNIEYHLLIPFIQNIPFNPLLQEILEEQGYKSLRDFVLNIRVPYAERRLLLKSRNENNADSRCLLLNHTIDNSDVLAANAVVEYLPESLLMFDDVFGDPLFHILKSLEIDDIFIGDVLKKILEIDLRNNFNLLKNNFSTYISYALEHIYDQSRFGYCYRNARLESLRLLIIYCSKQGICLKEKGIDLSKCSYPELFTALQENNSLSVSTTPLKISLTFFPRNPLKNGYLTELAELIKRYRNNKSFYARPIIEILETMDKKKFDFDKKEMFTSLFKIAFEIGDPVMLHYLWEEKKNQIDFELTEKLSKDEVLSWWAFIQLKDRYPARDGVPIASGILIQIFEESMESNSKYINELASLCNQTCDYLAEKCGISFPDSQSILGFVLGTKFERQAILEEINFIRALPAKIFGEQAKSKCSALLPAFYHALDALELMIKKPDLRFFYQKDILAYTLEKNSAVNNNAQKEVLGYNVKR